MFHPCQASLKTQDPPSELVIVSYALVTIFKRELLPRQGFHPWESPMKFQFIQTIRVLFQGNPTTVSEIE